MQILTSIKRNPIQVVAVLVVAGMVIQKILSGENIAGTDWGMYFWNLAMSYVAREFTVPLSEHSEKVANLEEQLNG